MMTTQTARQLYFAFIYSRIAYGIEVYGNCSKSHLDKLQTIQNKLLKMILQKDMRTSTNLLHSNLHLLKVKDIQQVKLLLFVNSCLQRTVPPVFHDYYNERTIQYDIRNPGLFIPRARTALGVHSVYIKGAKLWNELDQDVKQHRYKKNFKKHMIRYVVCQYVDL